VEIDQNYIAVIFNLSDNFFCASKRTIYRIKKSPAQNIYHADIFGAVGENTKAFAFRAFGVICGAQ